MPPNEPTIADILQALATQFDGPVKERQVLDRVLEQRPSTAKNPYATIRERLRWDGPALGWLRLDRGELVPVRVVLQSLRFRYIPLLWEIEAGLLPLVRLQPFVGLRSATPLLQDATGTGVFAACRHIDTRYPRLTTGLTASFDLSAWYIQTGFEPGDSIVFTITATEPLTLQVVRERREDFRPADVAAQDAALLEGIAERVQRSRLPLTPCDEVILPIFARASWRTGYPGYPWQYLVVRDERLQLVNDIFLAERKIGVDLSRNGFDLPARTPDGLPIVSPQAVEARLATDIERLQNELTHSRQEDQDAGVWDGQIHRSSTNHSWFDVHAHQHHMDMFDPLQNYGGLFDPPDTGEWESDDWEPDLLEEEDSSSFEDFLQEDADLIEASQRLMQALPAEALEKLQHASVEEAEVIIAAHLNDLLVREPSLFIKVDLSPAGSQSSHDEYNDYGGALDADLWNNEPEQWDSSWDDEWDEDVDVEIPSVYTHSSELMSQFYEYLISNGKSDSTARSRTRDLWVYAEFLAYYYNRTLAEGDYATLDECLFFFYPRKVLNSTPRQVREICVSLKQFYSFLKERGDIDDDQFAYALWRRRDQAARVVELYSQLTHDLPDFERLFMQLFAPYSSLR